MKKALIAGAASIALAAMPVVGVFADDPISVGHNGSLTDNFEVTIERSCSMSRKSGAEHTAGTGADSASKAWNTPYALSDTLSLGAVTAGAIYSLGSSTFTVICNGTSGYQVNAVATNFAGPSSEDNINATDSAISAVPTGSSVWTAVSSVDNTFVTSTDNENPDVVASSDDPTDNDGEDFTMTYTLGLKDGQASGSYTGSVAYTLVDLTED